MDEKRFQVFISSTYLDLVEARQAVVSTLLELDAFPSGMELFPAADDDSWTLIEDVIDDCDYYLLIVGGKYGSVDDELDISYTEREYDAAAAKGKPIMAFLHGEPGKLLAEQSESSDARRAKLAAFRTKIEGARHVKYWTSVDDLAGKVARSWSSFKKRYPAVGWIRADQTTTRENLAALARAQAEIDNLREDLEKARTEAPAGTARLAQGSQSFEIAVWAKGKYKAETGYSWKSVGQWTSVRLSWDRVFGYLGLRMMQEADEATLEDDLKQVIRADHYSSISSVIVERVKGLPAWDTTTQMAFDGVSVRNEDFQTILLQFRALGLVQQSTRGRSVKDTANYWTLTPYGHTQLVQLRAIQTGVETLEREPPVTNESATAQA